MWRYEEVALFEVLVLFEGDGDLLPHIKFIYTYMV